MTTTRMEERNPVLWHPLQAEEVAQLLQSNLRDGLDASEVTRRQQKFGPNRVSSRRGLGALKRLLLQFHQPLVYVLLVAAALTGFLGKHVDSSVILGVVLLNAIIGYFQESKAEKAIDSLAQMVPTETTVRREGRPLRIPSVDLVPGDLVELQAGDRVPADLRLLQVKNLQVDESALTGESVPSQKHAESLPPETTLADRRNMAFGGTLVTSGQAKGVVCVIGDQTETGRIASLISEAADISTPLNKKIGEFSRVLLWAISGLALVMFGVGLWRGEPAVDVFMAAVALAVAAIPEGLPAAVTITLAIGVARMAKRHAIIRKLPAVETLGSTTVICSDKTGTLTENQMTVQEIFAGGRYYQLTGAGYEANGELLLRGQRPDLKEHAALRETLLAGLLCNDSQLLRDQGHLKVHGDPTEAALIVAAQKAGLDREEMNRLLPRFDVIPFESEHMFRASRHQEVNQHVVYKIGAVERLLQRCVNTLDVHGNPVPLDPEAVHRAVDTMTSKGLRVLAFARRHLPDHEGKLDHGMVGGEMTFLGLQGMIDPPRPEAIEAVAVCRGAGIAVKMITGDHLSTAREIARQVGLGGEDLVAVSGQELETLPPADFEAIAERATVFARVAPEQKYRLVKALQRRGPIVAMTGDGVNDAPALRQADIGIAMGITGTDAAKGAADMVLTDDNFASIKAAVEEGRSVFNNLTKFIVWTLPTNVGQALTILLAVLVGITLPILPVQLLWVNMTTAVLLGLTLVFEPRECGIMSQRPRDTRQPILTMPLLIRTALVSLIMAVGATFLFHWEQSVRGQTLAEARTTVVNTIVMVQTFYLFNCRSLTKSTFSLGLFSNPWILRGCTAMMAAQALFTYAPFMNRWFHTTPIGIPAWLHILAVAAAGYAVVGLEKWLRVRRSGSATT